MQEQPDYELLANYYKEFGDRWSEAGPSIPLLALASLEFCHKDRKIYGIYGAPRVKEIIFTEVEIKTLMVKKHPSIFR